MSSLMTFAVKNNPLRQKPNAVAAALGWVGIGLGLAQLLRPAAVERRGGLLRSPTLLRLVGLREIATGAGLLIATNRAPWLAARLAGDAMDIAALVARRRPGAAGGTALALAAVAGIAVLDAAAQVAVKNQAQHDRAKAWDYSDRSGLRDAAHRRAP